MIYYKIKSKNNYQKLNEIILEKSGTNYKTKIANNYSECGFKNEDIYIIDYKLLIKCSLKIWKNILKKEISKINKFFMLHLNITVKQKRNLYLKIKMNKYIIF